MSTATISAGNGRSYLRLQARLLMAPAILLLIACAILPLLPTIYYSLIIAHPTNQRRSVTGDLRRPCR